MPPKRHGGPAAHKNVGRGGPAQKPVQSTKLTLKEMQMSLPPKMQKDFSRLFSLIDQRKYDEMLDICENILKIVPQHCEVLAFKGFCIYCMQPDKVDKLDQYITQQQRSDRTKPINVLQHEIGIQIVKEAADITNRQSHIPYQLYGNLSKYNNDYKTQLQCLVNILAQPNHQNSLNFNKELCHCYFMLGQYDKAFKHYSEKVLPISDAATKEISELTMLVDNILAVQSGAKDVSLLDREGFNSYLQKAIKQRASIVNNGNNNKRFDEAYYTAVAELNQLTLFKLYYYEVQCQINQLPRNVQQETDLRTKIGEEMAQNIKIYLEHIRETLKDKYLLNREHLYYKVMNLGQLLHGSGHGSFIDVALIKEAFEYLYDRNSNNTALFMQYVEVADMGCDEALQVLERYEQRMLKLAASQLRYIYGKGKDNALEQLVSVFCSYSAGSVLQVLEGFLQEQGVAFDQVRGRVAAVATGSLLGQLLVYKYEQRYDPGLLLTRLNKLGPEQTAFQAVDTINKYVASLVDYDNARTEINLRRKEDDKVHVDLPDVPAFADETIGTLIAENRSRLIQECYGIMMLQGEHNTTSSELAQLLMCLDVRDRCLNIQCACGAAVTGNFKRAIEVYQKFVARNDGLLYLTEYQEMNVLRDIIMYDGNSFRNIVDVEKEQEVAAGRMLQLALVMQVLQYLDDQRYNSAELYNYAAITRQQREVAIQLVMHWTDMLISRPIVSTLVRRCETLMRELRQMDSSVLEPVCEKYVALYDELFINHTKMDPPEYKRPRDDDYFGVRTVRALKGLGRIEMNRKIWSFVKRCGENGIAMIKLE